MSIHSEDSLPSIEEINRLTVDLEVKESRHKYGNVVVAQGFKRLIVWQESISFVANCYLATSQFPKSETYGLSRQLRDAAISISLNIAEGWGRNGKTEFARFCDIARASLQEVDAAFELAIRLSYISADDHKELQDQINRLSAMLLRLIAKLRTPKISQPS